MWEGVCGGEGHDGFAVEIVMGVVVKELYAVLSSECVIHTAYIERQVENREMGGLHKPNPNS